MSSRREALLLLGAMGAIVTLGAPRAALALGRTPYGGRVRMSLPWALGSIDPHDVSDPAAALFATAITDSLFAVDTRGAVSPALADAMPLTEAGGLVVRLRPGLKTAKGKPLDARDVVFSIARAKRGGVGALLARFGAPQVVPHDGLSVIFSAGKGAGASERYSLSRALASPLTAIVPRSFDPRAPDGTGPFGASLTGGAVTLSRNLNAARGASFLDSITIAKANDLTESLRAFESEGDDIGWLGNGLFGARKDAARFDLGRVSWVVLATSTGLGEHGAPGNAQRICDGLPRDRLAHLGLGPLPAGRAGEAWSGPPTDLLVDREHPHMIEIANGVADVLTNPDHEVTVRALSHAEIAQRRKRGDASLSLGIARPIGPSTLETLVSLAAADDPARAEALAKTPPKLASEGPRQLTSSLRVGVLGELRVSGASIPSLALEAAEAGGWDLGGSFIRAKKVSA